MKKGRMVVYLVLGIIVAACLTGCRITSASPGTTDKVVLRPGQKQVFKVDGVNLMLGTIPGYSKVGFNWSLNDDSVNFSYITTERAMGVVCSTFEYTPAPNDAGINTVEVQLGIWRPCIWCPADIWYFENPTDSRIWTVEVWGLARDPLQNHLVIVQGATQTLSVKPCPAKGEYTYQWFKDGSPIPDATTANFDFTPGPGDIGTHFIGVEAAGWDDGSTFTQAWEIEVSH